MYKVRPIYDDIRLFFDEPSHKYTDNLGNEYVSTTTLLHNYKPKFDKEYWLNKKAKELHISKERLAKQWQEITDEACKRGTKTHNGLEDSIKDTSMFYYNLTTNRTILYDVFHCNYSSMLFHIYSSEILSGAGISNNRIALIVSFPSNIALHKRW